VDTTSRELEKTREKARETEQSKTEEKWREMRAEEREESERAAKAVREAQAQARYVQTKTRHRWFTFKGVKGYP